MAARCCGVCGILLLRAAAWDPRKAAALVGGKRPEKTDLENRYFPSFLRSDPLCLSFSSALHFF
jgi:hypothetical protein